MKMIKAIKISKYLIVVLFFVLAVSFAIIWCLTTHIWAYYIPVSILIVGVGIYLDNMEDEENKKNVEGQKKDKETPKETPDACEEIRGSVDEKKLKGWWKKIKYMLCKAWKDSSELLWQFPIMFAESVVIVCFSLIVVLPVLGCLVAYAPTLVQVDLPVESFEFRVVGKTNLKLHVNLVDIEFDRFSEATFKPNKQTNNSSEKQPLVDKFYGGNDGNILEIKVKGVEKCSNKVGTGAMVEEQKQLDEVGNCFATADIDIPPESKVKFRVEKNNGLNKVTLDIAISGGNKNTISSVNLLHQAGSDGRFHFKGTTSSGEISESYREQEFEVKGLSGRDSRIYVRGRESEGLEFRLTLKIMEEEFELFKFNKSNNSLPVKVKELQFYDQVLRVDKDGQEQNRKETSLLDEGEIIIYPAANSDPQAVKVRKDSLLDFHKENELSLGKIVLRSAPTRTALEIKLSGEIKEYLTTVPNDFQEEITPSDKRLTYKDKLRHWSSLVEFSIDVIAILFTIVMTIMGLIVVVNVRNVGDKKK